MRLRVGVYTPTCKLHPFAGTACIADSISRYFQSLDERNKERYVLKLELAGLTIKEGPYLLERDTEWSSDVRNWPKIEYTDSLVLLYRTTWYVYDGKYKGKGQS